MGYYFDYSKVQNDSRISDVESARESAVNQVNETYDKMINESDKYYQAQIDAAKQWGETQKQNQQEQTDFAIEQIEQQKDQAQKDYTKEQSGAYVDWQKQSAEYGANAEAMADKGMSNTGYSESSQVSMYNTYQNRVATAREAYGRAVLNYDNAIKDARLQNNAALAEIAYNALQAQLELSLEGFQYKNTLIMAKTDKGMEIDNQYWGRYTDVLDQINTEYAFNEDVRQYEKSYAEEVRQYNEKMAEERRQYNESLALQKAELQLQKDKFAYEKKQDEAKPIAPVGGGGGGGTSRKDDVKAKANKTSTSYVADRSKNKVSAETYIEALIASGASKDKVANEISLALRKGELSDTKAMLLRAKFTPRGVQY